MSLDVDEAALAEKKENKDVGQSDLSPKQMVELSKQVLMAQKLMENSSDVSTYVSQIPDKRVDFKNDGSLGNMGG